MIFSNLIRKSNIKHTEKHDSGTMTKQHKTMKEYTGIGTCHAAIPTAKRPNKSAAARRKTANIVATKGVGVAIPVGKTVHAMKLTTQHSKAESTRPVAPGAAREGAL